MIIRILTTDDLSLSLGTIVEKRQPLFDALKPKVKLVNGAVRLVAKQRHLAIGGAHGRLVGEHLPQRKLYSQRDERDSCESEQGQGIILCI